MRFWFARALVDPQSLRHLLYSPMSIYPAVLFVMILTSNESLVLLPDEIIDIFKFIPAIETFSLCDKCKMQRVYVSQLVVALVFTVLISMWNTLNIAVNHSKFSVRVDGVIEKTIIIICANVAGIYLVYVGGMDAHSIALKVYVDHVVGVILAGFLHRIPVVIYKGAMVSLVSCFSNHNRHVDDNNS